MSIPYHQTGRTGQKARTRDALVTATRKLLAKGTTPTVEQAAAAASIARATAYRYFPNQRALLAAAYPLVDLRSLLPNPAPTDPAARIAALAEAQTQLLLQFEPELRTQLRLSLEADAARRGDLPLRRGRRVRWIEDALEPLRGQVPEPELRRLVLAIGAVLGVEPLVWLTDIVGLSREHAVEIMRWAARALLHAALAQREPHAAGSITPSAAQG